MVDRETFSRRLEALRSYLEKLKTFRDADEEEFVREPALHDLAERYLHLAFEACLDLANHWISDRGLPTPDTSRDTFTGLERAYLQIDHAVAYRAVRDELFDLEELASWPRTSCATRDAYK